uniref:Ovule protein n=1 Tax=Panagrellus redivivus TaxID=6233 RepID=A0A7E4V6L5_PANRE
MNSSKLRIKMKMALTDQEAANIHIYTFKNTLEFNSLSINTSSHQNPSQKQKHGRRRLKTCKKKGGRVTETRPTEKWPTKSIAHITGNRVRTAVNRRQKREDRPLEHTNKKSKPEAHESIVEGQKLGQQALKRENMEEGEGQKKARPTEQDKPMREIEPTGRERQSIDAAGQTTDPRYQLATTSVFALQVKPTGLQSLRYPQRVSDKLNRAPLVMKGCLICFLDPL